VRRASNQFTSWAVNYFASFIDRGAVASYPVQWKPVANLVMIDRDTPNKQDENYR